MNNVINIIDRDFNYLGQIDNYESFILSKKWHGIGSFELHLHESTTNAEVLQKENIIFTAPKKAFIILYRELTSADGKLVVKGLELKSYFARWLVFPPTDKAYFRINSDTETIMKEYTQATLDRKGIANIEVAANQNRGIETVYQSRYKNLADELEKLSLASGLGWDITLDLENKKFIFNVCEGQNRSSTQSTLPPTIFSVEYDNVAEQRLVDSKLNYANMAVVAGQGEGVEREISIVGDTTGLDCFELFVDARDIENSEDLPERGQQKLAEVQEIFTFDSQVLTNRNLKYEEDFNLGDIATIQNNKWNVTADRRIAEITEVYESTGFRLDIVFGESLPTIIEKIKQVVDSPVSEGGKQGTPGNPGNDGIGLEYIWDGTSLGVKREDESIYKYSDLEGKQGLQGIPGVNGKNLELHWDGTKLGVRLEGQSEYQYVDLEGKEGPRGPEGPQGLPGADGANGKSLEFNWNGTSIGIRVEGEVNYQYVNLKGDPGAGIPAGGIAGQILQKKSGDDYDTQWASVASGGTTIITSVTEPAGLKVGDQWHREI